MNISTAVRERRSIRKFLSKPVPKETIKKIIDHALWAPSWGNTQPWEIVVLSGDLLEKYKKANIEALAKGRKFSPDIPMPESWPDRLKSRYKNVGKSVLETLGVKRGDADGRNQYYLQMFSLFEAPTLVLFLIDQSVAVEYAMLDVGLLLQTFSLLAVEKGLGTCTMAVSVNYGTIAHELLKIPESKKLVIGTALGWPDHNADINRFERQRGDVDEFVKWII